jgi:hypothetical protein
LATLWQYLDSIGVFAIAQEEISILNVAFASLSPERCNMRQGDRITVRDYFGNDLNRIVVDWDEDYVFVCDPSEWEAANRESRLPVSIGFHKKYVVNDKAA